MKQHVARLPGAAGLIDALASPHAPYHAELHKDSNLPCQDDMHDMQAAATSTCRGTIILILGYAVRTGDEATANHVLDAIRQQINDVRDARRRRPPIDVNAHTGEPELPQDPAAPTTETASASARAADDSGDDSDDESDDE